MDEEKTPATACAADAQARAGRDLELLEARITAARQRLDELCRKQNALRAAVVGRQPYSSDGSPDLEGSVYTAGLVAGVLVSAEAVGGELVITVNRFGFDPAAASRLSTDPRSGAASLVVAVADENGDSTRLGQRSYFDLYPRPASVSSPPGQEAQQ